MIDISIRYFAALKEKVGKNSEDYSTDVCLAGDLYAELKKRYQFTLSAAEVKVAINEQFEKMDYVLQSGDQVVFIPPMAGG